MFKGLKSNGYSNNMYSNPVINSNNMYSNPVINSISEITSYKQFAMKIKYIY